MRHPAQTGRFFYVAVTFTLFGLACVAAVSSGHDTGLAPVGLALGGVLVAIGLINFAVHALALLLRDHEMWRSTHFTEITETGD
ncbi:hypothetical protein [Catellatospora chokoriensis]|uniref:Uncharacterized protein n=1 Tax=Catellatospora chokoriensis TaxID=310353 RepID=A0A8J3K495_9ACTN|nr:hypothetical protein [Catellatospora chokoriensis]GIF93809.1 hypothetical protein Cch02nite_72530 [Catellatospora chokoriensis]